MENGVELYGGTRKFLCPLFLKMPFDHREELMAADPET